MRSLEIVSRFYASQAFLHGDVPHKMTFLIAVSYTCIC